MALVTERSPGNSSSGASFASCRCTGRVPSGGSVALLVGRVKLGSLLHFKSVVLDFYTDDILPDLVFDMACYVLYAHGAARRDGGLAPLPLALCG